MPGSQACATAPHVRWALQLTVLTDSQKRVKQRVSQADTADVVIGTRVSQGQLPCFSTHWGQHRNWEWKTKFQGKSSFLLSKKSIGLLYHPFFSISGQAYMKRKKAIMVFKRDQLQEDNVTESKLPVSSLHGICSHWQHMSPLAGVPHRTAAPHSSAHSKKPRTESGAEKPVWEPRLHKLLLSWTVWILSCEMHLTFLVTALSL